MKVKNLIKSLSKQKVNIFYVFKKLKLVSNWSRNWNKCWWVDSLNKKYSFNHMCIFDRQALAALHLQEGPSQFLISLSKVSNFQLISTHLVGYAKSVAQWTSYCSTQK